MANDNRSGCKAKDENNERQSDEKGSSSVSGSTGLRRSARETSSKKVACSPSSTRKSVRLEKKTPPTLAVRRKSARFEKKNASNTLRRSERTKNQASLASSEFKSSGFSYSNQNKHRKEKSVQKLIEDKEVSRNEKHNVGPSQVKSQRMNARAFRQMFKVKAKKDFHKQLSGISQSTKKGGNNDEGKIGEENQAQSKENLANPDFKLVKESLEENSREELVQLDQKSDETNKARMSKNSDCEEGSENGNHALLPSDDAEAEEMSVDSSLNRHVNGSIDINRGVELSFTSWKCNSGIGSESDGGNCMEVSNCGSLSILPLRTHKTSGEPIMVKADLCEGEKLQMVMSRNSTTDGNLMRNNVSLEISEKLITSKKKGIVVDKHSDVAARSTDEDNCNAIASATSSRPCEYSAGNIVATSGTCSKRIRVDHDPTVQEAFSCDGKSNESIDQSANKDRGETEASITTEVADKGMEYVQQNDSSANIQTVDKNICLICKRDGQLLYCGGRGCNGCCHFSCLEPPIVDAPLGVWLCPVCVRKKIESGVYSVSEGVESIWDVREVEVSNVDGLKTEKQFFVKYKGLAHVHNRWVPESQLVTEAPLLLVKFNKKDQVQSWKPEWTLPHRLLQKRALITAKQHDDHGSVHDVDYLSCRYEWLVKWRGLGYDQATWELENAVFLCSKEGQNLIRDYEDRHRRAKRVSLFSRADKKLDWGSSACKLSQMPAGISSGFGSNNLDAVNRLRERWHKGQNAIVIDDHDRFVKVIAFILSLQHDAYRPFLIISSSSLHLWEDEFLHLAPSVNVITYTGNKEIRKSIRRLEFYEEEGCILFQVLIVAPEIIIEDLDVLGAIRWESIIVDECQCSHMSSYFQQFKMLNTDMRLLLFSGQLKDSIGEHHKILALLDHPSDNTKDDGLISNSSDSISQLKERLSNYIAYRCKPDSIRFAEYWVPVQISNVQLEQYCATLLSNSSILRSLSKNDLPGALDDVLISNCKCCSHPYIVDPSLQTLLTKGLQAVEYLDVGIKASGKLQLLDLMLMELKKQGLRGLVLFQSIGGSGRDSIGDILDDYLRQRFGPDAYERVDKGVLHSKKLAALRIFNEDSGRFVFLLETSACSKSIKLSSIDIVVIFNSDRSPMNDITSLQRITLDSQFGQIKIFRLYSSCTVEEKALILAKQDKILDSNVQNISRGIIHMLLMWGASYLFDDLKVFHEDKPTSSHLISVSGESLLKEVVHEFSSILSLDDDDYTSTSPILLKVQQSGHFYRSRFPLLGEQKIGLLDEGPPHKFWTKLLEGKHPKWKYLCSSSPRSRKRPQHFDASVDRLDIENGKISKKHQKVANNVGEPSSNTEGEGRQLFTGDKEGNSGDLVDQISERLRGNVESGLLRKLHDEQRNLHRLLKPEIAKLCDILFLPDTVRSMVYKFLEYIMNNHHVDQESESILQAFQISLCWTASSLLRHKIDHRASLLLVKQHLNFRCKKEEADFVYSKLRCLKKLFLYHTGNLNTIGSPKASELLNRIYSNTGQIPEVELAKIDIYKSKKEIQHKFQKQLKKLILKQQQEKETLNAANEQEKAALEENYKIESAVIRAVLSDAEKMKNLNREHAERIEELKCKHEMRLKDLEAVQLAIRQKYLEMEAVWLNDVESWAQDQLLDMLPSKEVGTEVDYMQTNEQESENGLKNVDDHVADGQGLDKSHKTVEAMPGTGVGSPVALETTSTVLCSNPIDEQAPLVKHSHGNEVLAMASEGGHQGNIMSLHSCSKDQNFERPVSMSNNGEGHDSVSTNGCREDSTTLVLPSSDGEDHGTMSNVPGGDMAVHVHKAGSSNDDLDEIPPSGKETITGVPDCGSLSREIEGVSSIGGVKNIASLNSQSSKEHITSGTATCMPNSENATRSYKADGSNFSNNAVTLNSPLFEERVADGSMALQDPCTSSCTSTRMIDVNATIGEMQDSNQQVLPVCSSIDIVPDTQSNQQSHLMEPPQQGQILTSAESPLNPHITGVLWDLSHQVEPASSPLGIPTNQSNFDAQVGVPQEPVQPLLLAQPHPSNQNGAGEIQDSSRQDEPVSSQVDGQGDKSSNRSLIAEPLEQVQLLQSAQPYSSNQDTAREMQESSQQVEPVSSPLCTVQSIQSNNESLVLEPLEQGQLLQTVQSHSFIQDPSNSILATGAEDQPSNENSLSCHVRQLSIAVPNHAMSNSEPVLQAPVGRYIMQSSDTRNMSTPSDIINHPILTAMQGASRTALPMYPDPLKNELERIRKEKEQAIKNHKDMILLLKSDCEKEIAEIRKKYDIKMQQAEDEFQLKKKNLDTSLNIVLMNKILAEAFRSKCMDPKIPSASGMQQDTSLSQQLGQLSRLETATRPSLVAGPPGPQAPSLQITSAMPSSHAMVPPTQAPYDVFGRSPSVSSRPPSRPPHINSISSPTINALVSSETRAPAPHLQLSPATRPPYINSVSPTANVQFSSEIRAPAPHLQPYRSLTPLPAASPPIHPKAVSSQQVSSDNPTTSVPSPNLPLRLTPTHQFDPQNGGNRPHSTGGLPAPNLSACELSAHANVQNGLNIPNVQPGPPVVATQNQSDSGIGVNMQGNSVLISTSTEVVYLSDDD